MGSAVLSYACLVYLLFICLLLINLSICQAFVRTHRLLCWIRLSVLVDACFPISVIQSIWTTLFLYFISWTCWHGDKKVLEFEQRWTTLSVGNARLRSLFNCDFYALYMLSYLIIVQLVFSNQSVVLVCFCLVIWNYVGALEILSRDKEYGSCGKSFVRYWWQLALQCVALVKGMLTTNVLYWRLKI